MWFWMAFLMVYAIITASVADASDLTSRFREQLWAAFFENISKELHKDPVPTICPKGYSMDVLSTQFLIGFAALSFHCFVQFYCKETYNTTLGKILQDMAATGDTTFDKGRRIWFVDTCILPLYAYAAGYFVVTRTVNNLANPDLLDLFKVGCFALVVTFAVHTLFLLISDSKYPVSQTNLVQLCRKLKITSYIFDASIKTETNEKAQLPGTQLCTQCARVAKPVVGEKDKASKPSTAKTGVNRIHHDITEAFTRYCEDTAKNNVAKNEEQNGEESRTVVGS
ncbi:MAG: hypothetical protein Q9213_003696 [Squamulea squamosa]